MNRDTFRDVCAIISTLAETGSAPESVIYLALGCDMSRFESAINDLARSGFVSRKNHTLTLTAAGKVFAARLADAVKSVTA